MSAWKSPRCGSACWEEIHRHEAEQKKLLDAAVTRIRDLTADRNEWRTQHENLLAMYRAEVSKHAAVK